MTTAIASSGAPLYAPGAQELSQDLNGNLRVNSGISLTPAYAPAAVSQAAQVVADSPFFYAAISTNTTTLVKTGSGILHSININTKGASSNTASVYDSTTGSGTPIAVIDTTSGVQTLLYDITFSVGLSIVTATGTAANLTVSYK